MSQDTPTLDQLEELLASDPNRFSSPLQTQRSINNARGADAAVQDATARAHYSNYLGNGGTPIGSNGQMSARSDTLDQQFGSASCNCGAASPCCLTGMIFKCSHGSKRMELPLTDPEKKPILVLVTDQAGSGDLHDKITLEPKMTAAANCRMTQKKPVLRCHGAYVSNQQLTGTVSWPVPYADASHLGSTDFSRFVVATKHTIFGDIEGLRKELGLEVLSCARRADLNATLHVYPKLEWKSSGFAFEIKVSFLSNMTFYPEVALEGSVEGTFHDSTFKVGIEASTSERPMDHASSMIPFLDTVLNKMKGLTGQTAGERTGAATRSKIEVSHKFALGESKFTLAEHATDHSKIGIDSEITIGYAPLLGITAEIDVIDLVLTVAQTVPAATAFARALQKARDAAATGYGDENTAVQASAHAALKLVAGSEIGGTVVIKRAPADDAWQGSGKVEGKIRFSLIGQVRAEGRVYVVEGSFAAEGEAVTDLTGTVATLTRSESTAANGAKFKTTIEWGGIKLKYKAVGRAGWGVFKTSSQAAGELVVQEKATWYENTA